MYKWGRVRAARERVECLVVGAGVVGLAIARQLALEGKNVVVLEAASAIGTGTSSRNSQVIHAGIYYPAGSFKARLCVLGNRSLYKYCQHRAIPHARLGKLIVATSHGQLETLQELHDKGIANGAEELEMVSARSAMQMEPELRCVKALWSPTTGIIDTHSLMLALQGDAEERGVSFALNTTAVGGGAIADGGVEVYAHQSWGLKGKSVEQLVESLEMVVEARHVINAAGLHATAFASGIQGMKQDKVPLNKFAKGNYFAMPASTKPPFSRLIYPLPEPGGLGVHLTLDLGGGVRFGPDVQWLSTTTPTISTEFDYSVDPERCKNFYSEIRKYYPGVREGSLRADYAGVRPKLCASTDFVIQGEEEHGVPGLVNLFGIESPGLTACLEMANMVSRKVRRAF